MSKVQNPEQSPSVPDIPRSSLACLALMRLGTRMAAQFDSWFTEVGITQAQFRVLLAIWQLQNRTEENSNVTPSALAEYLFIERPTVTILIAKLVERGLLIRIPDTVDRRSYGLRLTEEGGAMLRMMSPVATEKAHRTLAVFDTDEQDNLLALLERLETHLRNAPPL